MNRAIPKLSPQDCKAVDLLLDAGSPGRRGAVTPVAEGLASERVESLTRLLNVLAQMPEPEVPANLAARTMQKIEGSASPNIPQVSHATNAHVH